VQAHHVAKGVAPALIDDPHPDAVAGRRARHEDGHAIDMAHTVAPVGEPFNRHGGVYGRRLDLISGFVYLPVSTSGHDCSHRVK
jgi:hypothetical protein